MAGRRIRADYYLFHHFLMGMGAFSDEKVISHQAMKLVFGINEPFRIRLQETWHTARVALIDGACPQYLNGSDDWQIVLWIEPGTSLWKLLHRKSLKGQPWVLQNVVMPPSMNEVIQVVGDPLDPHEALQLAEMLIRLYCGATPVPAIWDEEVKNLLNMIDRNPGEVSITTLEAHLDHDFQRVIGSSLEQYLHRRKWMQYLGFRYEGIQRRKALELSGLTGWEGLRDSFEAMYGLEIDSLEQSLPYQRIYNGHGDQPVLYI